MAKFLLVSTLLFFAVTTNAQVQPPTIPPRLETRQEVIDMMDTVKVDAQKLDTHVSNMAKVSESQKNLLGQFEQRLQQLQRVIISNPSNPTTVKAMTIQMSEAQQSFNLQYLQLQSQMQHENRSYTATSNIMKTKHDTVKNSISNVR